MKKPDEDAGMRHDFERARRGAVLATPGKTRVTMFLDNDVLGDGSLDDHSWTFEDGEVQPDGSVLVDGDHGVLHVFDDGEYIYTPYGESQGPETFSYTLTDADALEAALLKIRADDLGTDNEEFVDGLVACAVPVKDRHGRLFACLFAHAPLIRKSLDELLSYVPLLREAAAELGQLIDHADEATTEV